MHLGRALESCGEVSSVSGSSMLTVVELNSASTLCCISLPVYRECVRTGAAGAHTRRSLGHHLLHPQILADFGRF